MDIHWLIMQTKTDIKRDRLTVRTLPLLVAMFIAFVVFVELVK
jgi:hypothetical protein